MTIDDAIRRIADHIATVDQLSVDERNKMMARMYDVTPLRGCLLMLEALGLVKFKEEKRNEQPTGNRPSRSRERKGPARRTR